MGDRQTNPAEALRSIAEDVADQLGLEVDHEAFDRAAAYLDEPIPKPSGYTDTSTYPEPDPVCRAGQRREPDGRSGFPRFNPYSIPRPVDPLAVDCPYCVKRPRNLRAHCRAVHPDKPEAR